MSKNQNAANTEQDTKLNKEKDKRPKREINRP